MRKGMLTFSIFIGGKHNSVPSERGYPFLGMHLFQRLVEIALRLIRS